MSDGQLAVIGVGSVGSMALWQASKLGIAPVGFEAVAPAHPRSAVGGDTRLFRMTYRGEHNFYPVLQLAERLWRRAGGGVRARDPHPVRGPVDR